MRRHETYVHGRDPETARLLLAACDRLGLPQFVVRVTDTGFLVPDQVWDLASESLTGIPAEAF